MKWPTVLFSFTLFWSKAISEVCETPLGRLSSCVFISNCTELFQAIQQTNPKIIASFLSQSICGYGTHGNSKLPKVCCGPLPSDYPLPWSKESISPAGAVDPVVDKDSYLAPSGNCGKDSSNTDKIVGGSKVDLDEFPWMALLGYHNYVESSLLVYKCGGALINHRYVLTAAHCIADPDVTVLGGLRTVRLGEYDTGEERDCVSDACADAVQEILVHSTSVHPDYNISNKENDIALVRLARRAKFTDFVKPICLMEHSIPLEVGTKFYVAGWGRTKYEYTAMSQVKLKVELPVYNKAECDAKYEEAKIKLNEKQICAGGTVGKDSCQGDSGGPLMMKNSLQKWECVGITSFGNGCGKEGWPGVYTSISSYIDWIKYTISRTNKLL